MYNQGMKFRAHTLWTNNYMWRCTNHIPSSKVYPAVTEFCPSCKAPRPPLSLRPPVVEEGAVVVEAPTVTNVLRFPAPTLATTLVVAPLVETITTRVVPEPPEKAPKGLVSRKTDVVCVWPPCVNKAREASPYCSKVCSDRCLRLRRKAGKDTETPGDVAGNAVMRDRLAVWTRA